ncbi:MAG: hypothetical protein IE919_16790 [Thioclava sp.]|nr:primase-helicase zinc-binding domain-containing protein [Thioclava sp.]MBD3804878.1 hypothetical protein [Thioclava sp.]
MAFPEDPRIALAQGRPIGEIADRLGLEGLRKITATELAGPCPVCGGRDRFNINTARGVFLCRQCGGKGDGIALVRHTLGCSFPAALDYLEGQKVEIDPAEMERRRKRAAASKAKLEADAARYRARAIEDARKIWARAERAEGSPVMAYLAARAIRLDRPPVSLRYLPDHPFVKKIDKRYETLHRGPCMIAAIQGRDDRLAAVHQTWLDLTRPDLNFKADIRDLKGERISAKMVRGSLKGGAIRLGGQKSETLVMGEGIETTLSARVLDAVGPAEFWAGVSLGNMAGMMIKREGVRHSGEPDLSDEEAWIPPEWVRRLIFIRDGDSAKEMTFAKLRAGIGRAISTRPGLVGEIVDPGDGKDLNDLLRGQ